MHYIPNTFLCEECLQALTSCGCDIDAAISWLCERPSSGGTISKSFTGNADFNESSRVNMNGSNFPDNTKIRVEAELQQMMAAAAKAKKDADHKEELRRINRAWNLRAEGEKKRLEMEKRAREVEKQQRTLAAQKLTQPLSSQGLDRSCTPQVHSNTAYCDRGIAGPKSLTIGGSHLESRDGFTVIQQQYFPPLINSSQLIPIYSQETICPNERGNEQTLIPQQLAHIWSKETKQNIHRFHQVCRDRKYSQN